MPVKREVVQSKEDIIASDDSTTSDVIISNEDIVDGTINYDELDEKVKNLEEKSKTESTIESQPDRKPETAVPTSSTQQVGSSSSSAFSSSTPSGDYMVMSGSFLVEENAQKMKDKLHSMGYNQSEIVVFESSDYHSVIAGRFNSQSQANMAAVELKNKGVDSYVRKRQ